MLVAVTKELPPNWLKLKVVFALKRVSLLLSPPAVLFQVAVTVSPILYAPPVPVAPEMLRLPLVTVRGMLSTVALLVSAAVVLPKGLVAVTLTFLPVASMEPAVKV